MKQIAVLAMTLTTMLTLSAHADTAAPPQPTQRPVIVDEGGTLRTQKPASAPAPAHTGREPIVVEKPADTALQPPQATQGAPSPMNTPQQTMPPQEPSTAPQ
ncbi:MAG TPA: hypothetical protein VNC84_03195 [Gammaproteobacteria bacterium]|jgi:hypothetical protein|nr:hypothetical protein [Gammaproteobacteria bacterium]